MELNRAPGPPAEPEAEAGSLATAGTVQRLGAVSRVWRTLLVLVLGTLFIGGTAIGDDHWWPFAPWRMFSTSTAPGTAVVALSIERRVRQETQWRPAPLTPESVGLNRAEVEGRIPEMTANPGMLATLAQAHARLHPQAPRWTGVRVVRSATVLEGRSPTGEVRRSVLAEWVADR